MSTHATIGWLRDDSTVDFIYLHFDGYPDNVLPILSEHCRDEDELRGLINRGDLNSFNLYQVEPFDDATGPHKSPSELHYKITAAREHGAAFQYLFRGGRWHYRSVHGEHIEWQSGNPTERTK